MTVKVSVRVHGGAHVVAIEGTIDVDIAAALSTTLEVFEAGQPVLLDLSHLQWTSDDVIRRLLTPAVVDHPGRLLTTALVLPRSRLDRLHLDGSAPHVATFSSVADALQALVLAEAGYGRGWDPADDERAIPDGPRGL